MARKKKEEIVTPPVNVKRPKPKYKLGDQVLMTFLGQERKAIIIEVKEHPSHPRWIYKVKDRDGTIIPWVGINNEEKFSNIIELSKTS